MADPGVLHHVAERRYAFFDGLQTRGAETAAVGHVNLLDRFGTLGDGLPQAEALVDQPAAVGQRGGAGVIAGLVLAAGGEGFDQGNAPAALMRSVLQGQRLSLIHI